jgi:hypothetical protein
MIGAGTRPCKVSAQMTASFGSRKALGCRLPGQPQPHYNFLRSAQQVEARLAAHGWTLTQLEECGPGGGPGRAGLPVFIVGLSSRTQSSAR